MVEWMDDGGREGENEGRKEKIRLLKDHTCADGKPVRSQARCYYAHLTEKETEAL